MKPYKAKNNIRIVTAASLFDGHDAAINIMRRILQSSGAEVIHLGHDRSVKEVVTCAIQEDVQAIAITSYQGGHMEYFKYMYDSLKENKCSHIKIFGGGGGTILPSEIRELHKYGITRLYHADDGRAMGLQGMINDLLRKSDFPLGTEINQDISELNINNPLAIASLISAAENFPEKAKKTLAKVREISLQNNIPVIGITGTGGSGKSSLIDELVRRYLADFKTKTIGIISVDPSKRKSGGALLGDRIRMNSIFNERCFMRSLATRQSNLALSPYVHDAVDILKVAGYDLIILETSGIGQSDTEIIDHSDVSLYVMTPEYGAATQLEKIDMLDFADVVVINKSDKRGAEDALRDVKKQFSRNRKLFGKGLSKLPVFDTVASQFNDAGVNILYKSLIAIINRKHKSSFKSNYKRHDELKEKVFVIPPDRSRYLSEISETVRQYHNWVSKQSDIAKRIFNIHGTIEELKKESGTGINNDLIKTLNNKIDSLTKKLDRNNLDILKSWENKKQAYRNSEYEYIIRDKKISVKTHSETLSHTQIPKIVLPAYKDWGEILRWNLSENVPGEFPFTAGVFPFKREGEDPTRMFAGEGSPERTNKRFHYLSEGMPAKRLSTAFDSVTLYGKDPDIRPDIYGKIGNSGVSVCCLDDAKKLYSGFDLCDPKTSVSMTINGPAPMMLAFYLNTVIDQQCELYIRKEGLTEKTKKKIASILSKQNSQPPVYHGDLPKGHDGLGLMLLGVTGDQLLPKDVYQNIKADAISKTRGTVQADILKEDQAQNTCIFSTEFALRLMGDVQEYFNLNHVRNFYSVSISGYHIAEAGANPITQLAFTLANGFTYIEYYLSRGMDINVFAPNLSFFFSNGIDAEYAVIGRVARRIWATAVKLKYGADQRAQKLKYHIQTSGRSLHAQEISFNDIRTSLQALYAIYDNCNSLHTNAYDEAITTPTEESVRRAMAIQLIINHELGLAKNENPLQGSFIIEELTNLVEEAVLAEFDRITDRGGVLGAMETMYQRSKIQEESLYYENLKNSGKLPVIGVNTFLSSAGSPTIIPEEVIRASDNEKKNQINTIKQLTKRNNKEANEQLRKVQLAAIRNENIFNALMETVKKCSLGQITNTLFAVGGQYRRNM